MIGRAVDVDEELGAGGLATVHLAESPAIKNKVALKRLYPHIADVRELVASFIDEARLAPPCLVGSEDEIVASLEERRERWQMSYHVIDDNAIDTFAPIVARLAGK